MPHRSRASRGGFIALYRSVGRPREGLTAVVGACLLAALLSGCASAPFHDDDSLITGSIKTTPASMPVPDGPAPKGIAHGDWTQAKLALDQALAARDGDVSVPWDNPETGARGTATPVGPTQAGCRAFMISLVDGKTPDRWVQGEACKSRGGTVLNQVRLLGRA